MLSSSIACATIVCLNMCYILVIKMSPLVVKEVCVCVCFCFLFYHQRLSAFILLGVSICLTKKRKINSVQTSLKVIKQHSHNPARLGPFTLRCRDALRPGEPVMSVCSCLLSSFLLCETAGYASYSISSSQLQRHRFVLPIM